MLYTILEQIFIYIDIKILNVNFNFNNLRLLNNST